MVDEPTPEERAQLATASMAWGMGCSVVASILICVIGGLLIDKATDRTPLFTLIGMVLGLIAAGYQLWELAQLGSRTGKVGPVAKGVAKAQRAGSRRTGSDQ